MRCCLFYTFKISIAFAIRSVDPTLGLWITGLWRFYTPSRTLSHSLFAHLIPSGAFKGWCDERTLQMYFSTGSKGFYDHPFHSALESEEFLR